MTYVPEPRRDKTKKRPNDAANTLSGDNRVLKLAPEKPGSSVYIDIGNGTGTLLIGVDQEEGGNVFAGAEPHAAAIGTVGEHPLHLATAGRIRLTIESDGTVLINGRDLLDELDAALTRITELEAAQEGAA